MELRKALFEELNELMTEDEKIVVLGADLDKPNGVHSLKKTFPDRALSLGIAEQNMVGVAAGLASNGFIPFVNTFVPFLSRRALDQICVSVSYANNPVKLIGTDPGIAAELNGGTHMSFDDIGALRSVPGLEVLEPADAIELKEMIRFVAYDNKPYYIRMSRKYKDIVHSDNYKFDLNKLDVLKEGNDLTIITSGIFTSPLLNICNAFNDGETFNYVGLNGEEEIKIGKKINIELINLNSFKTVNEKAILESLKKTKKVLTIDNHNILGGINSIVSEIVVRNFKELGSDFDFKALGIENRIGQVGPLNYLKEDYALDDKSIIEKILSF